MPADHTLPARTAHHGNGDAPYPCYEWPELPHPEPFVDYGYCRHSLDTLAGIDDPRCPVDCPHKAPADVADEFDRIFKSSGAQLAARYARRARQEAEA